MVMPTMMIGLLIVRVDEERSADESVRRKRWRAGMWMTRRDLFLLRGVRLLGTIDEI